MTKPINNCENCDCIDTTYYDALDIYLCDTCCDEGPYSTCESCEMLVHEEELSDMGGVGPSYCESCRNH